MGLEPTTSTLARLRSSQLSYTRKIVAKIHGVIRGGFEVNHLIKRIRLGASLFFAALGTELIFLAEGPAKPLFC